MFTTHRVDKNAGTTRRGRMARIITAAAMAGGLTAGLVAVGAPANAAPVSTQAAAVHQPFSSGGRAFDHQSARVSTDVSVQARLGARDRRSTNLSTDVSVQAQLGARDRRSLLDTSIDVSLGLGIRIL